MVNTIHVIQNKVLFWVSLYKATLSWYKLSDKELLWKKSIKAQHLPNDL